MFKVIKSELCELLKEKDVSLAMIYDISGKILWSYGRNIVGKNVREGEGFCKSYIEQSLKKREWIEEENELIVESNKDRLSESGQGLLLKKVVIQPVDKNLFLYTDTGKSKESFNDSDKKILKMIGKLLKVTIEEVKENKSIEGLIGNSEVMKKVKDDLVEYAIETETVLLEGETGTGKNHLAELIHKYSGRKGELKVVNAPTIPENLFESEIFGHKQGTFTDAREDRMGILEAAEGGTILIDEISEIPTSVQAKLLRLLDIKKYFVLGETKEREADVRIIAATNRDLKNAIKKKEFREDLYYRLNRLNIKMPPLRERKEDIRDFVIKKKYLLKGKEVGKGFWEVMYSYHWPGNVRELINVLTILGIKSGSKITGDDVKNIILNVEPRDYYKNKSEIVDKIWEQFIEGQNFWEVIRNPYLNRDLNRDQVRQVIRNGLKNAGNKYINLMKIFNLDKSEYTKFIKFLNKHKLK